MVKILDTIKMCITKYNNQLKKKIQIANLCKHIECSQLLFTHCIYKVILNANFIYFCLRQAV